MQTNPRYQISETGTQSLVGADEQVDQNDYGTSIAITLGNGIVPVSGEFLSFMFFTGETGTGSVQIPAGSLLLFDADPAISAGDTALALGCFATCIGRVDVAVLDYQGDTGGATAYKLDQPIPFHALNTIYAAWFHSDAASFNDAPGDDEIFAFNAWYRRDS